ncbi:molecular chaperone DnaJ [Listeria immobilis]|uniref:molecular chaperone DnaJ n=1 Tax=Listeria immobilis TaxID=2713502 RepID=UPI0021AB5652|nr:molecular chaperone DnaJ [Listeria immobilis]
MGLTVWEILKIEKTTDKRVIKRAYAKALKYTHPEDEPVAFQKLKEAFDQALKYQAFDDAVSTSGDISSFEIRELDECNPTMDLDEQTEAIEFSFKERLEMVFANYNERINIEAWREIFQSESAFKVDEYERDRYYLAIFLIENRYFIPKKIINLAFEIYNLNEMISNDTNLDLVFALKEVKDLPPFEFVALQDLEENERIRFILARLNAYQCLETKKIQSYIKQAKAIFDKDPDLELIEIISRTGKFNFNSILKEINAFIAKNPEQATARMYRLFLHKKLSKPLNYKDLKGAILETYYSTPRENEFFDEIIFHIDKNKLLGLIYYDLKEYTTAYTYLINASDTSRKEIRDRVAFCLKLKLEQEKNSFKNKSKINDIRTELSLYSLWTFEQLCLKTQKKRILLMLILTAFPVLIFAALITDDQKTDTIWANYWFVFGCIFVIILAVAYLLFRKDLWKRYREAKIEEYYQNKK